MKKLTMFGCLAALCLIWGCGLSGVVPPSRAPKPAVKTDLDELAGKPVDIAAWAYAWRADRTVQEAPEACFIPRRLERIDKVYRTACAALPASELKSIYYDMPDLLQPLPPQPKGQLQAGLLWTGGVTNCQVELHWPACMRKLPSPDAIEVRVYPTSFGWFGWTVDKILVNPEISEDGRTWTYKSDPTAKMDSAYSTRVDAATEMVAVFYDREKTPGGAPQAVPNIRVAGPGTGTWKRMDVEIEWGFQSGAEGSRFDGRLEPSVAMTGPAVPLAGDKGLTVTGGASGVRAPQAMRQEEGLWCPCCTPPVPVRAWTAASPFGRRRPVSRFA